MSAIVDDDGVGIVYKLKRDIKVIEERIQAIQLSCSHPKEAVTEKSGSNTGNYDPSADLYWKDFHCHLCDARWSVDQ